LPPLLPPRTIQRAVSEPDRDQLYARIDGRYEAMLSAGALEEVAALAARRLDPLLPAMKAHGVPALIRHLKGEISLQQAAVIGRADTRHYAKRQFTWFRTNCRNSNGAAGRGEGMVRPKPRGFSLGRHARPCAACAGHPRPTSVE